MTPGPFSVMRARLDQLAREALARAGQVGPYDADVAAIAGPCMWPHQYRVVCPEPADPDDPYRMCAEHATQDAGGRA